MEVVLTGGEKVAYKKGNLIVSDEQMAVCFLVAKYAINEQVPKFSQKFSHDLSIECGMNAETFRRCVEKFKILFLGLDEDAEIVAKECIYKKLRLLYNKYYELPEKEVFKIAEKSFTDDNQKMGLAVAENRAANQDIRTAEYKQKDKVILNKVALLYTSLNNIYKDASKSKRQAISKTALELDVDIDRVTRIWNKDDRLNIIK